MELPQGLPTAPSRPLGPESPGPSGAGTYPESWAYRLKNRILGPPMVSEQLTQERLSTPVAIGVLAPDMISSSAYGTEEMLVVMVPIIGLAAFSMVIPITLAILAVMVFVMISYSQVIGVYTKSGGSYVVARDNFGPNVAQVAAVALLIDYTVTVAVQTSAGTAALSSAFPALAPAPYTIGITVLVTLIMLFGNLRGIREAGSIFAIPTYFYVVSLSLVVITGLVKGALG
ncbi:MAG: amino acid permease, partial [Candidatus Dormiibacterota bacterium]